MGRVSQRNGIIGKSGGFVVFPTYEQGHGALIDLLKNEYANTSLQTLIRHYAPPEDNNDTKVYLNFLLRSLKTKNSKLKVKELTPDQFEKLWKAIERMEGWKEGKITALPPLKQITKVMKNEKGTIVAYFVPKLSWIAKDQAILLAQKGELDAVIATSRSGNLYLRTRPDLKVENNLALLG